MQDRVSKTAKDHVADYVGQMQTTDPVRWAKRESKSAPISIIDPTPGRPTSVSFFHASSLSGNQLSTD
jgi:hypothetical protein